MDELNITSAEYQVDSVSDNNIAIKAVINSVETYVPLEAGNKEYDEIMRQVNAGTLTIQDAD
jgi:hypothetical protein